MLFALVAPSVAAAHVILESSVPAIQSQLDSPPTEVRLRFNQPVTITANAVQVLAPDGTVLSGTATTEDDGHVVVAPVSRIAPGHGYTVRWRAIGSDGHSPAGVFTFGVGVVAPPPTEAVGASGTTWRDDLARWALFGALALLIGPLVVRLVVLRGDPVPDRLERRFHLVGVVAAFLVVDVGIAAFVLRASNALQLPIAELPYGDLQPFAEKTRFGVAFLVMTVGFGVGRCAPSRRVDLRSAGVAMARARALARARVGPVAVRSPGDRAERVLGRGARGLAAPGRCLGVGGRRRRARVSAFGHSPPRCTAPRSSDSRDWPPCSSPSWCSRVRTWHCSAFPT